MKHTADYFKNMLESDSLLLLSEYVNLLTQVNTIFNKFLRFSDENVGLLNQLAPMCIVHDDFKDEVSKEKFAQLIYFYRTIADISFLFPYIIDLQDFSEYSKKELKKKISLNLSRLDYYHTILICRADMLEKYPECKRELCISHQYHFYLYEYKKKLVEKIDTTIKW